jgi:hypothetical protein
MLVTDRCEMLSGGLEGRSIAASRVVKMDRVSPWRRLLEDEPEKNPSRRLLKARLSNGAALPVREHCVRAL